MFQRSSDYVPSVRDPIMGVPCHCWDFWQRWDPLDKEKYSMRRERCFSGPDKVSKFQMSVQLIPSQGKREIGVDGTLS